MKEGAYLGLKPPLSTLLLLTTFSCVIRGRGHIVCRLLRCRRRQRQVEQTHSHRGGGCGWPRATVLTLSPLPTMLRKSMSMNNP
jgi:hypothetical protein